MQIPEDFLPDGLMDDLVKEQAWLYRDEMRDLWVEEPEAMAMIRRTPPSPSPCDA